jgi:membrane protein
MVHNETSMSERETVPGSGRVHHRRRRFLRAVVRQTVRKSAEDRVLGLAAEAGFWGIVSLPSLALSLFGALGYLRGTIGDHAVNGVRDDVLRAARDVLTPATVNSDVAPLLDQILARGHPAVISIAFIVSLWSGSTAMTDYVNTITVAYEMRGIRSWWRTRIRSLVLYLGAVVAGIVILPGLALGPDLITNLFPDSVQDQISFTIHVLYIPVVGIGSIVVITLLYHLALPRKIRIREGLPGALLAVVLWFAGSDAVRTYLTSSFHSKSAYGSLASPIAALLFFYVTALAVLLGAEVNSAIGVVSSDAGRRPHRRLRRRH